MEDSEVTSRPSLKTHNQETPFSSHFIPVDDDFYSFHCHWNHCDFSFTAPCEFDNHLLFNHIPLQNETTPVSIPFDVGFQCQWDECQTKASSETDLVNHIRIDHLPDSSKEHHQCLWVNDNGGIPPSLHLLTFFQERYVIYVVHRQKRYPLISKQITLAQERDPIPVAGKTASEHKNHLASDKK